MEKVLRSFIHEHFPLDLRVDINLIGRRRDIRNKEKQQEIIKLLQSKGIDNYVKLGPGTNRYAFKLDGFVVKVATDHDGRIDNLKEFKMTKRLYPDVAKTYEVSSNGDLLIAEYIQPFNSYAEMLKYADKIREKLKRISSVYLIGDAGISSNNFANWGLRIGSEDPVCLDFAYVYDVSSSLFICRECTSDPGVLIPDKDFNLLYCSKCGTKKTFEDIRTMIGNDIHNHEIGDLTLEGYEMFESNVLTELTVNRSNYLINIDKKKDKKKHNDYGSYENEDNIKEEEEMATIELKGTEVLSSEALHGGITLVPSRVISIEEYQKEIKESDGKSDAEFIDLTGDSNNSPISISQDEPASAVDTEVESENNPDNAILNEYVFQKYGHTALSKLANRIVNNMKEEGLFSEISECLSDKMIKETSFYNNLHKAILQSLGTFLKCSIKSNVPNRNKPGTHDEYILPENMIGSEEEPTFIFIARLFLNPDLKDLISPADAALDEYYKIYDNYLGIQAGWWSVFTLVLQQKIHMNQDGVYQIYETLSSSGWLDLVNVNGELETPPDDEEEGEEAGFDETDQVPDISGSYAIEGNDEPIDDEPAGEDDDFDEEEETLQDIEAEVMSEIDAMSGDEDYLGDDEENFDSDQEATEDISVEIFYGEDSADFDIIKISAEDYTGDVSIPFYVSIDRINSDNANDQIDPRNRYWDWLTCFKPSAKFITDDPDKYMEYNDMDYDETDRFMVIFVILSADNEGNYLMGMYRVHQFLGIKDVGQFYIFDDTMYWQINNLVKTIIHNSVMSVYFSSLDTDGIVSEHEFDVLFEEQNNDQSGDDEEEEFGEEEEESVASEEEATEVTAEEETVVEETATSMEELEEASMAALEQPSESTAAEEPDDNYDDGFEEETTESIKLPDGVQGYLVEERRNKKVKRRFYLDPQHIELISGDHQSTYVDITPGDNYGATYKWNGSNFIKSADAPKPISVQEEANEPESELKETVEPETSVTQTTPPQETTATNNGPSKPGAIMPKRVKPVSQQTSSGAMKPKTSK